MGLHGDLSARIVSMWPTRAGAVDHQPLASGQGTEFSSGSQLGGPPTILEVVFRTCHSRRKVTQGHKTNYCAIFLGSGGQKLTVLEHFLSVTFYPPWDYQEFGLDLLI